MGGGLVGGERSSRASRAERSEHADTGRHMTNNDNDFAVVFTSTNGVHAPQNNHPIDFSVDVDMSVEKEGK